MAGQHSCFVEQGLTAPHSQKCPCVPSSRFARRAIGSARQRMNQDRSHRRPRKALIRSSFPASTSARLPASWSRRGYRRDHLTATSSADHSAAASRWITCTTTCKWLLCCVIPPYSDRGESRRSSDPVFDPLPSARAKARPSRSPPQPARRTQRRAARGSAGRTGRNEDRAGVSHGASISTSERQRSQGSARWRVGNF